LFERAEAARRAGDPAAMRAALLVLVRDHPTSPFVPHAYFAFGEFYFAEGRMQDAANLFEKASMFPDSDVVPFAMHRIAWCQVNLGDDQKALQGFMNATRAAKTLPPERARPLAIASVFDSVGPFVRAGKLERAPDFYRRFVDGTGVELDAVLERVVATAVDSGRGDEIVKLCRDAGSPRWCSGGEARPRAPQP